MKSIFAIIWSALLLSGCQYDHSHENGPLLDSRVNDMQTADIPDKDFGKSIIKSHFQIDPLVENGSCYEAFVLQLQDHVTEVCVPESVKTCKGPAGFALGQVKKTLSWAGHPAGTKKTSITTERRELGLAAKIIGHKLHLVPFGAWDSMIEGGASVEAVVQLPSAMKVKKQKKMANNSTREKMLLESWQIIKTTPSSEDQFRHLQ